MDDEFIIWGRQPVMEALESDREFNKIFVARGGHDKRIVAAARERRIPVVEVDKAALDRMTASETGVPVVHQGVVAQLSPILYAELDDLAAAAQARREDLFVAVLDGITDPQNLGSIIRTANAVGAHGVVIPARRSSQVSPVVAKASAGAVAYTLSPVWATSHKPSTGLRRWEPGLLALLRTGGIVAFEADLTGPIAVVVGSEGKACRDL